MPRGVYPRKKHAKTKKSKKAAAQPVLVVGKHVPIDDEWEVIRDNDMPARRLDGDPLELVPATDAGGTTTDRRLVNAYLRHQEATQHLVSIAGVPSAQVTDITNAGREMIRAREVMMGVLAEWVAERRA